MRIIAVIAYVIALAVLGYQTYAMDGMSSSADALVVATLFLLIAQTFTGVANAIEAQRRVKLEVANSRLHALQEEMLKHAAEVAQNEKDEADKKDIN